MSHDDKNERSAAEALNDAVLHGKESTDALNLAFEQAEELDRLRSVLRAAPSTPQKPSIEGRFPGDDRPRESPTPKRWRVRDEQGDDLITYWRTFQSHSNEVAAADIIEELESELAEDKLETLLAACRDALPWLEQRGNEEIIAKVRAAIKEATDE